jgi:hypothetical protein
MRRNPFWSDEEYARSARGKTTPEQRFWDAQVAEVRRVNPCGRCPYRPYMRGHDEREADPRDDCVEGVCEVAAPSGDAAVA